MEYMCDGDSWVLMSVNISECVWVGSVWVLGGRYDVGISLVGMGKNVCV